MPNTPGAAFRHGTVKAGGFTLDYAEAGPAETSANIVSLPGSAGLEMSTAKDRLVEEYRVVEINPPGWGGRKDLTRPLSQRELGNLLAEAATALVDRPFIVLGTSMGGTNALYLAAQETERTLGIILEGSMAPIRPGDLRTGPADPDEEYPLPPTHPRKPWAGPEFLAKQMADRKAMFHWTQPDFEAAAALAVVRRQEIPVLALLGDEDEILKPSQETTIHDALPHADFHLVRGGTHDLQNTVPDEFVALVRSFAAELS